MKQYMCDRCGAIIDICELCPACYKEFKKLIQDFFTISIDSTE